MEKCEFCNKKKKTKTIFEIGDESNEHYQICENCCKIEAPYLDWNKMSNLSK